MFRYGRRAQAHPDRAEASEWVRDEVDRLHALRYDDLLAMRDVPRHHPFMSRTGRQLVGEACVHWDGRNEGPLRVLVDVWEPRRLRISRSIASDDFMLEPSGRFVGQ